MKKPETIQTPMRWESAPLARLDHAVGIMRMGGKCDETGREWSRESFIRYAVDRTIKDLETLCGGKFPEIPNITRK